MAEMKDFVKLAPETKLMYAIFGESAEGPRSDDDFHHEVDGKSLRDTLIGILTKLEEGTPRTRHSTAYRSRVKRVIMLRFGFVDGQSRTLEQVAYEYGVTRERIRQHEILALRQLRHARRVLYSFDKRC